ncbi:MAG: transposase [Dysgonamonadaceae bacterium]|nr:transposase [Dysgonamonadaceae bacterium]
MALAFGIAHHTASKYMRMTEDEIQRLDSIQSRAKRPTQADDYLNIIYKMQRDGYGDDIIYHYVVRKGYKGKTATLWRHIYNISMNNFPDRKVKPPLHYMEWLYPDDVTVIKRSGLLKYILTIDPKKERDETIGRYIDKIRETYPVVEMTEKMFSEFHAVIMGKDSDAVDEYILKYQDSKIAGFCAGIKKDIAPVKNAVSMDVSSGFVEGNNNKFKLIKRTLYGRAGLPNLTKKCKLAFANNNPDFSLKDLL